VVIFVTIKYMKKQLLALTGGFITLLFFTNSAIASEIQYGHVEEVNGPDLYIQYKGPGGQQNFICDVVSTDCESYGTSTPDLFPEIDGGSNYANSPDGNYGITENKVTSETASTTFVHTLYDISGDTAIEVVVIPYDKEMKKYKFSWASDHLVLFGMNGDVVTYDIENKTISIIKVSQTDLLLRSLSPHAKYLSAYNYTEEAHKIWDTNTGEETVILSAKPAFVEFSQTEEHAAFIDDRDGYQTLYVVDLTADSFKVNRVFKDDFTVEDYLWFKGDLYAVANTEDNPYAWSLYRYDVTKNNSSIVAEDVSYGDYIRPVGEYALSFLTIAGKNSHVALYYPETDSVKVISPVTESLASTEIKRQVVEFGDTYGVLYEPKNPDKRPELFVWLHGGPKRQTSFGYHSYLSYAVYDELLERLVESGAYVLKLDYPGSYGYGNDYLNSLDNELGVVDVESVTAATRKIQKKYRIDDTYLIGNSYGGYLGPKALVEESKYFNGAIAINGVFDWFDLLARIPSSPFKTYFKGLANLEDLDENFGLYEQASIVNKLPDLSKQKKMLLIYGEDDSTVPTWQTKEFFYSAKSLSKNVDLLKLKNEDHIIRSRDSLNIVCGYISEQLLIKDLRCEE